MIVMYVQKPISQLHWEVVVDVLCERASKLSLSNGVSMDIQDCLSVEGR